MGSEISVLVVDEDPEVLELTRTFLERQSDALSVATETDAETAIQRTVSESFDCVVSDYRMPAMDGIELYERLSEDRPDLPFFLFTAADKEVKTLAEEAGFTGYVQKGSGTEHYEELAGAIRTAVDA